MRSTPSIAPNGVQVGPHEFRNHLITVLENLETVRRAYEAYNRRDVAGMLPLTDEECTVAAWVKQASKLPGERM
jgi:hypothetical protein